MKYKVKDSWLTILATCNMKFISYILTFFVAIRKLALNIQRISL